MKTTTAVQKEPRVENRPQPAPREYVAPEVNIYETREGYMLEAEMPGVSKEGLEITLENNELTIVGHREVEPAPGFSIFNERSSADFRRVFELDPAVDTNRISAKMDQGVLHLTLPKSERVKPRKISVE
jgi:HSP20 family protein